MKTLTALLLAMTVLTAQAKTIRIATFNVSMDATNYVEKGQAITGQELPLLLKAGTHPQIKNIAEIIQTVRPDILLLNEFDYIEDEQKGIGLFQKNFLSKPQNGAQPIEYAYRYIAPVNTGIATGLDLDKDGVASDKGADAYGFGFYPGHYGMALLSKYPLDKEQIRTFQLFKWKDMPDNLLAEIKTEKGEDWFSKDAQQILRLSSKSHWDIPVIFSEKRLHILASHPTPPVFDGPENRNGKRNFDEIRFWKDYLTPSDANYIYDDKGQRGGFKGSRFVIMGDQNASPAEGDSYDQAINQLLNHSAVNASIIPKSEGGVANKPENEHASTHTAGWGLRVDYVLPSKQGLKIESSGVFWPKPDEKLFRLIADRKTSSDHRLVWIDVKVD